MRDTPKPKVRQAIGARLLEERTRLGLTQQAFADAVGGARLSVIHYESGRCSPGAETLAAMDAVGVDIRFVLTGCRSAPLAVDRQRFKVAYEEVLQRTKISQAQLTTEEHLDQAWQGYEALGPLHQ